MEDSYIRCACDVFGQTVPEKSSDDWKSSITDSRQSGTANNQ